MRTLRSKLLDTDVSNGNRKLMGSNRVPPSSLGFIGKAQAVDCWTISLCDHACFSISYYIMYLDRSSGSWSGLECGLHAGVETVVMIGYFVVETFSHRGTL